MNGGRKWLACMFAMAMFLGAAQAEISFDGSVVAGETVAVTASIGGIVKSVDTRAGAKVNAGDVVASVEVTKVFSPVDGTVRGIAAEPGDSAENVVFHIAPISKYTVGASIEKAYSTAATKYVRIGELVHISCTKDGTHRAVGRIAAVDGSNYTVEVTGGELYMEETVYIYRNEDYATSSRIGSGTVSRTPEIEVRGTGVLLSLAVSEGDEVERGQLLFETVESTSGERSPISSEIVTDISGVVAEVGAIPGQRIDAGATVLTVCPREGFRIELSIPEGDLGSVSPGDKVRISFAWDEAGTRACEGTISEISYLGEASEDGEVAYSAYVEFDAAEDVRLGMTVSAAFVGGDGM